MRHDAPEARTRGETRIASRIESRAAAVSAPHDRVSSAAIGSRAFGRRVEIPAHGGCSAGRTIKEKPSTRFRWNVTTQKCLSNTFQRA
jgi:hypothetical protein